MARKKECSESLHPDGQFTQALARKYAFCEGVAPATRHPGKHIMPR